MQSTAAPQDRQSRNILFGQAVNILISWLIGNRPSMRAPLSGFANTRWRGEIHDEDTGRFVTRFVKRSIAPSAPAGTCTLATGTSPSGQRFEPFFTLLAGGINAPGRRSFSDALMRASSRRNRVASCFALSAQ